MNCYYSIIGTDINETFIGEFGRIDQYLWQTYWDNITHGDRIIIRFWIKDAAGNLGFKDVELYKYSTPPKSLLDTLGGPLGLILTAGIIGLLIPVTTGITRTRYYKSLNKKDQKKIKRVLLLIFTSLSLITLAFII